MKNKNNGVNNENFFGIHLTLDGYGGDKEKLNDLRSIYDLLDQLPALLGMKKLHPPFVVVAPPVTPKDQGGISGFVMITESHISIHTFPNKGFVSADIYTCKNKIDDVKTVNFFKEKLNLREVETGIHKRGLSFE